MSAFRRTLTNTGKQSFGASVLMSEYFGARDTEKLRREFAATLFLGLFFSAAVLALFVLCYPRIFAVTFDETFSRATGVHTQAYNMLLAVLTAVTIVLGMRMMGALLISSLIIFPALTAMRVFGTFRSVTICAAVVSVVNFLLGMVLSYVLETPSGASVVVVDLVVFLLFCGVQRIQCRVKK